MTEPADDALEADAEDVEDTGLQYLTVEKSPAGYLGATRLIEYLQGRPYMQIQRPPGSGESTEGGGF